MNITRHLPRILFLFAIIGAAGSARSQALELEKGPALELRTQALTPYPNPFDGTLHVNIPFTFRRAVRIDMYPVVGGPAVFHQEMGWMPSAVLETSTIPNGTYSLTIRQVGDNGAMLGVARVTCAH
jgi:hypothetical protein